MKLREIGDVLGTVFVGMMLGLLIMLPMLKALGALDEKPGVNPFGNGQIFGTAPKDEPKVRVLSPEEIERRKIKERWRFDNRKMINPFNLGPEVKDL